jgi:hypothetical protein
LKSWFKEEIPTKKECVTCDCYCERKIKGKKGNTKKKISKNQISHIVRKRIKEIIFIFLFYTERCHSLEKERKIEVMC